MSNFHEPLPQTKVNKELERLRKHLPLTRVNVQDGYMVYSFPYGLSQRQKREIDEAIKKLKLDLKMDIYEPLLGTKTITIDENSHSFVQTMNPKFTKKIKSYLMLMYIPKKKGGVKQKDMDLYNWGKIISQPQP